MVVSLGRDIRSLQVKVLYTLCVIFLFVDVGIFIWDAVVSGSFWGLDVVGLAFNLVLYGIPIILGLIAVSLLHKYTKEWRN